MTTSLSDKEPRNLQRLGPDSIDDLLKKDGVVYSRYRTLLFEIRKTLIAKINLSKLILVHITIFTIMINERVYLNIVSPIL